MSFSKKIVIVTGASSGMGKSIALKFAKSKAFLSLVDVQDEDLKICAEYCEQLSEAKVIRHVVDLRNNELVKKVVDDTMKEFGRIDVVVNCAGIYRSNYGNILDSKVMEEFDEVMSVNLRSVVRMTNCAAPFVIKTKGCFVNISSVTAILPSDSAFSYLVSKAAVCHFTKCVALQLAPYGVRVNAILPGNVPTNIIVNSGKNKKESDAVSQLYKEIAPLKMNVNIENIADMAHYLASDSASSITGSDFVIDAGLALVGMPESQWENIAANA